MTADCHLPTIGSPHPADCHLPTADCPQSSADQTRWDARYREVDQPSPPSLLLLDWCARLTPGRALDLACGSGGNLLALAERGWDVTGIDVSPVALNIAQREARRRGLSVALVAANLGDFPLPRARYDLVNVSYFLDRLLAGAIVAALRPGGTLVYETFTTAQLALPGGPRSRAFLLEPGELPRLFPSLHVLHYEEGEYDEGGRTVALARLVARREDTI